MLHFSRLRYGTMPPGVLMKAFLGSKTATIVLGVISILAVVILAAGISSIKFKSAEAFALDQTSVPTPVILPVVSQSIPINTWLIWVLLLIGALGLIMVLLDSAQRKRLLRILIRLVLFVGMAVLLIHLLLQNLVFQEKSIGQAPPPAILETGPRNPPPAFIPPHPPAWAVYLITLAILLALLGAGWWMVRYQNRKSRVVPLEELVHIARTTLDDIQSGGGWEDAIVQCYVRMSAALSSRRNLTRPLASTPTEFADQLVRAGLPASAVQQLTMLFERARYGAKTASQQEVAEAVDCLTAILHAVGEAL